MAKRKRLDCVELQHHGGDAVYEIISRMTREEEIAYWEQQTREFRVEVDALRHPGRSAAGPSSASARTAATDRRARTRTAAG
jgi:hypothetical protein